MRLSPARLAVLEQLMDQPQPCTVVALAKATGQHQNTVREHLDALVEAGLAERSRAEAVGRGRPAWLYAAEPSGPDLAGREYAGLAAALARQISESSRDPRADALRAGEGWGRELARSLPALTDDKPRTARARRDVVTLLDGLHFAPDPDARAAVVKLRRCPLLEAAHQNPEIVCGVHLGLVRGALRERGGDPDRADLHPFSEPGACRLEMMTRTTTAKAS